MLLLLPLFLLLGFWLPGFFIAKYLRHKYWLASAFPISLLILFHAVFWLGVFGVPIALGSVLACLIAVSAAAAWLARTSPLPRALKPMPNWTTPERILITSTALVGAALLLHSALSPLTGFDTLFRWDFLAQRILALGNFDFYPPLTPSDFRSYFFVDGIPPLVSFAYWWLYASAGSYLPALTCIFIAAQFASTLAFTYGAASALFSRRAGVLAAALLAACPLYFTSVVMGQETGLTALSIAAMVYFIVTAAPPDDTRAMVSAGLAAALCVLSREYGWAALLAGAIALVWRRFPLKQVAIFAAVATAVGAPWYIRNFVRTGNPLYSLPFAGFPVNPVHDAILQVYNGMFGVGQWTVDEWAHALWFLLLFATLPMLAGIAGAFHRFRERGYLTVIALLMTGVWIQSIGYTSGGMEYSARVLSPVLAVLCIMGAGILEPLTHRARWYTAVVAAIVVTQIWTAAQGSVYPYSPFALRLTDWGPSMSKPIAKPTEFQVRDQLSKVLPPGTRVLTDSAYLHVALLDKGVEVVPVWSPEVRFLFSAPPEEADRQLQALHIDRVVFYPKSLNTRYLEAASPFYAALPQRWHVVAQVANVFAILRPGLAK